MYQCMSSNVSTQGFGLVLVMSRYYPCSSDVEETVNIAFWFVDQVSHDNFLVKLRYLASILESLCCIDFAHKIHTPIFVHMQP